MMKYHTPTPISGIEKNLASTKIEKYVGRSENVEFINGKWPYKKDHIDQSVQFCKRNSWHKKLWSQLHYFEIYRNATVEQFCSYCCLFCGGGEYSLIFYLVNYRLSWSWQRIPNLVAQISSCTVSRIFFYLPALFLKTATHQRCPFHALVRALTARNSIRVCWPKTFGKTESWYLQ